MKRLHHGMLHLPLRTQDRQRARLADSGQLVRRPNQVAGPLQQPAQAMLAWQQRFHLLRAVIQLEFLRLGGHAYGYVT